MSEKRKTYFVIPARRDSKGFPFKNRKLLDYTINQIPLKLHKNTIVTTNDEKIIEKLSQSEINVLERDEKLSLDSTNIRDVMEDVIDKFSLDYSDTIIMLYLTSPERKFSDIEKILDIYKENNISTLTCCMEPKSHPCLCFLKQDNNRGKQIIEHDLPRRQDYPECFELSHFVCIFQVGIINKLNKNMYNENTYFHKINPSIDVDHETDFKQFLEKKI